MVSVYRYIRERLTRFWTFVFGQEICIPRTEAAFWKDDRLSAADCDDVTNKVVSSAYTRSVKDDEPTLMPGLTAVLYSNQEKFNIEAVNDYPQIQFEIRFKFES